MTDLAGMFAPIDRAASMVGTNVAQNHAAIQDYLKTGGANLDPATAAWCAAFVNSTLGQSGIKGTGSNLARSFLNFGTATDKPQHGDIAVMSRGDPKGMYGHVGFVDAIEPDGRVRVLGGNQGHGVGYADFDPSRVLGYRHIDAGASQNPPLAGPSGPSSPQAASPATASQAATVEPALAGGGASLADAFMPAAPAMAAAPVQDDMAQRQAADKARRQALFGSGGVADMFG